MSYDVVTKRAKATKIAHLLHQRCSLASARILDIGTGIGVIASALAEAAGPDGRVISIDTMDTRVEKNGYEFRLTSGVHLPFDSRSFDVIVSNHVVEHVGTREVQQVHLDEISRVLADGGTGYLATPSRWALVEPHFKLPLLSWPPQPLRNWYVAATRKGKVYDVWPYGPWQLRRALSAAGLEWHDSTMDALDLLVRTESRRGPAAWLTRAPAPVRRIARCAMPTMIYTVSPARS